MRVRNKRHPLVAALVAVVALLGASCGGDDGGESAPTDAPATEAPAAEPTDAPSTEAPSTEAPSTEAPSTESPSTEAPTTDAPNVEAPETIRIGYQLIPNGDAIVKNQGWLEEAFPDTTIEWSLFDSGGAVNEAILAGSIDIGLAGSSPTSRGISSGIEYQVPWIHAVIGTAEALVVKSDAGVSSIEDLAGKTVATPIASTAHYSLLAALESVGLSDADVNVIDATPDAIVAAWLQGDIDAAYIWNPSLAALIEEGGTVLITSADLAAEGKTTYDLAVVTNDFASTYPAAVQTWLEQQDRAVQLLRDDPQAASEAIAAELNITPEEALEQTEGLIFLTAEEQLSDEFLGAGLPENLFAAALFNVEQGQIPEAADESAYSSAVNTAFAAAVASG